MPACPRHCPVTRRTQALFNKERIEGDVNKMEPFETETRELSAEQLLLTRDQVLAQMKWMRDYTLQLIDSIPEELWLVQPEGLNTHVAWQVGHLAVAEYGLMLFRQRGRNPGDMQLLPGWLRKKYGRGSVPAEVDEKTATPQELRQRLDAIHAQTLAEVPDLAAETLAEPTDMPYTAYPMKIGALLFCPLHESLHAGQIGLLRRAHGLEPLR